MRADLFKQRKQWKGPKLILKDGEQYQSQSMKKITHRYRPRPKRTSLPNFTDDIQRAQRQSNSDIYFDQTKKSKFMRGIVDDYFTQKINNSLKIENNQVANFKNTIRQTVKKGKLYPTSINPNQSEQIKLKPKELDIRNISQPLSPISQFSDKIQIFPNTNSFPPTFLPPIHQSVEDNEQALNTFPQFSYLSTEIPLNKQRNTQSDTFLSFQNQAFMVYVVTSKGKPNYRLKQYKPSGLQIMKRQQKSVKLGVQSIWKQSTYNINTFTSKFIQPLKNLTTIVSPTIDNPNAKYKVRSTNYRKYLFANNCQQFKHLIRQICLILKKVQNRILNNKINPSNIFVLKGNKICIGQWGYSSFRQQFDIQSSKFQSRVHPILKSQIQWLVTPQYLAPQILLAVNAKTQQQQPDLWEYKSASDIWSLGITLFQILTKIPIWINDKCLIKTKNGKGITRPGLLGTSDRNLQRILKKQRKMEKLVKKCLETQIDGDKEEVCSQIKLIIERMLYLEPSNRITLDQILEIIR